MIVKQCEFCGNNFECDDKKRFCSHSCRSKYAVSKVKKCNLKGRSHSNNKKGGWKCLICGEIFRTRREKQAHNKNEHLSAIKPGGSWKRGLTAKNCESIARGIITRKENIKNGKTIIKSHSKETRKKISDARKKYLLDHPDKSPYRLNNKNKLGESYPERYFRKLLKICNVDFKQEVQISLYSLDFLIGNIDLEIDGNQHYTDERIIESDKRRTKYLEDNGFIVKRIRWSYYMKLGKQEKISFIKELISFLKNNKEYNFPNLNKKVVLQDKRNKLIFYQDKCCPVCGNHLKVNQNVYCCHKCSLTAMRKNIPSKEFLLEKIKELKFNKTNIGKFYGVSDNAVKKWMRLYNIPTNKKDFYEWLKTEHI